jgi:large-conductance mechanosensitive channel
VLQLGGGGGVAKQKTTHPNSKLNNTADRPTDRSAPMTSTKPSKRASSTRRQSSHEDDDDAANGNTDAAAASASSANSEKLLFAGDDTDTFAVDCQHRKTFLGVAKKLLLTGDALSLATGYVIGAAFAAAMASLIKDILLPPILSIAGNVSLRDKFSIVRYREWPTVHAMEDANLVTAGQFATLDEVRAAGIDTRIVPKSLEESQRLGYNTVNWGQFIELLVILILSTLVLTVLLFAVYRMEFRINCMPDGTVRHRRSSRSLTTSRQQQH